MVFEARSGRLEKIAIKAVRLINRLATQGQTIVLYKDNLNALFNADELCDLTTAREYVLAYQLKQDAITRNNIQQIACKIAKE